MKTVFYVVGISLMTMFGLSYLMNFDLEMYIPSAIQVVLGIIFVVFIMFNLYEVGHESEMESLQHDKVTKAKEKKQAVIVMVLFFLVLIVYFFESNKMAFILNFNILMRYVVGTCLFSTTILFIFKKINFKQSILTFLIIVFLFTPIFSFMNRLFIDDSLTKNNTVVVLRKYISETDEGTKFYVCFNWNNQKEEVKISEDVYDEIEKSVDLYIEKGLFTDIVKEVYATKYYIFRH